MIEGRREVESAVISGYDEAVILVSCWRLFDRFMYKNESYSLFWLSRSIGGPRELYVVPSRVALA